MSKSRKLQVFVSSTFTDLVEERQAAVSAILKSGHIPAGMELFTAGDKSQMEVIRKWIDSSDVYLLILGGRYGSIDPTTSLSYTELEFDYAVEAQKPLFSLVMREEAIDAKVKAEGRSVIEQVDPKSLAAFREKVLKRISTFVSDDKDIRLAVFESLADYEDDPRVVGWVRADHFPDQVDLNKELASLRTENKELKAKLAKLETSVIKTTETVPSSDELISTLSSIEMRIPAAISGKNSDVVSNLFDIAYGNRDTLIAGVHNEYGMSDASRFLFFNVGPKLQTYGLAESERVPGKAFRRLFLNKAGQQLFAEVERRLLQAKPKKGASTANSSVDDEKANTIPVREKSTRARRAKKST